MSLLVTSIVLTAVLYIILLYASYLSSITLYNGIKYKLALPTLRASSFILFCYISIITDVVLFDASMYVTVMSKNGILLVLSAISFVYAKL